MRWWGRGEEKEEEEEEEDEEEEEEDERVDVKFISLLLLMNKFCGE